MDTNVLEFPRLRRAAARASATTGRAAIVSLEEHRLKSRVRRTLNGIFIVRPPAPGDGPFAAA
ncbi:MAG: hypothetical protein AAFO80_09215 [Pseudomonadota bacterium]